MGPFSRITKGFNYVKSTLKGAYQGAGMRGVTGVGLASGMAGYKSGMAGAKSFGKSMKGDMGMFSGAFKQMRGAGRSAMGHYAGGGSARDAGMMFGSAARSAGMGLYKSMGARKLGAYSAAGLGIGAGAADFANPWGLGWGD